MNVLGTISIPDPLSYLPLPMLGLNSTFGTVGLTESVHWSSPKCFLRLHLHYRNSIAQLTRSRKKRRSRIIRLCQGPAYQVSFPHTDQIFPKKTWEQSVRLLVWYTHLPLGWLQEITEAENRWHLWPRCRAHFKSFSHPSKQRNPLWHGAISSILWAREIHSTPSTEDI